MDFVFDSQILLSGSPRFRDPCNIFADPCRPALGKLATLIMSSLPPHLAHGDSVDGRLPTELLNKLPLLLELLHFSFVRKHWDLRQSINDFIFTY